MGLILAASATAIGIYGIWYSIFAEQFNRYLGFRKSRYEPTLYQRGYVLSGSLVILIVAIGEVVKRLS